MRGDLGKTGSSEVALNQKVKKLIQKLGEAIHESVSESEDIAVVVKDIREQGFDVLLMLEATIGLNEVDETEDATDSEGAKICRLEPSPRMICPSSSRSASAWRKKKGAARTKLPSSHSGSRVNFCGCRPERFSAGQILPSRTSMHRCNVKS